MTDAFMPPRHTYWKMTNLNRNWGGTAGKHRTNGKFKMIVIHIIKNLKPISLRSSQLYYRQDSIRTEEALSQVQSLLDHKSVFFERNYNFDNCHDCHDCLADRVQSLGVFSPPAERSQFMGMAKVSLSR